MNRNLINDNFVLPVLQEISLSAQELSESLNINFQFDTPEQFLLNTSNIQQPQNNFNMQQSQQNNMQQPQQNNMQQPQQNNIQQPQQNNIQQPQQPQNNFNMQQQLQNNV